MALPADRITSVYWTPAARRTLVELARREQPREAAALLGGPASGGPASGGLASGSPPCIDTVLPLASDASATDRFEADPRCFARREHELRANGRCLLGFAHSHPSGAIAPSARDRAELWTECVQAITDGRDVRAYWLDAARTVHPLAMLEAIR